MQINRIGENKERNMAQINKYMRISELAKLSGVPVQKIRNYVQKGILPRPIKINKTAAFYTQQHLKRLELVNKLQSESKLQLPVIGEIINSVVEGQVSEPSPQPDNPSVVRELLVDCSIEVFQKKGYESATITDIVNAANIARKTFYKYFRGKEELFVACLNEIILRWSKQTPRNNEGLSEISYRERLNKIFVIGCQAYPKWSNMLNLLRAAAVKDPDAFQDKLRDSLEMRMKPIVEDVRDCIDQGVFREVNAELLAMMVAGIFEYVCYFIHNGKFDQGPMDISEQTLDILFNGVLAHPSSVIESVRR
jgi:AcrR family transcriptional regulator